MKNVKEEIIDFQIQNTRKKKSQFKVQLSNKDSLYDLHAQILEGNGWNFEHSFSFFMSDKFWDDENEYAGDPFSAGRSKVSLKKLNLKPGSGFYRADHGRINYKSGEEVLLK